MYKMENNEKDKRYFIEEISHARLAAAGVSPPDAARHHEVEGAAGGTAT